MRFVKGEETVRERSARSRLIWLLGLVFATWVFLFVVPVSSLAVITFERTYGVEDDYRGYHVQQTFDMGYIVVGFADYDVYLLKTDSLGDSLWARTNGGSFDDQGYAVQQALDGGYVVVGITESFGAGNQDMYLFKTDSVGNPVWTRTYGGWFPDGGYSLQQTLDGGYVITGFTESFGSSNDDIWLVKTDSLGDSVWTATYDNLWDIGRCVRQTRDGGYVIAGYTGVPFGDWDIYVVKTDSSGSNIWAQAYGDTGCDDWAYDIQQTSEGGYILAGRRSPLGEKSRMYLIKIDSLGSLTWSKSFGDPEASYGGYSVGQTPDSGFVIAGYTYSSANGWGDVYIMKTNSVGNKVWARTYGGSGSDKARSIQRTVDGGYVIAGTATSLGGWGRQVYLIKTGEDGLVNRDVGTVSLDAPGDTVFADSTYAVTATVQNFLPGFPSFDVIATIDGYSDTVCIVGLPPGSLAQITFKNWHVPPPDSTIYAMTVCTHALGDVDSTNDCMQKTIFAYDPVGVTETFEKKRQVLQFRLNQNRPNPFHGSTVINYSLPAACMVTLQVYDISGRLVETLADEKQGPGVYQARWNPEDTPTGIYFYILQAGSITDTKKMILVR